MIQSTTVGNYLFDNTKWTPTVMPNLVLSLNELLVSQLLLFLPQFHKVYPIRFPVSLLFILYENELTFAHLPLVSCKQLLPLVWYYWCSVAAVFHHMSQSRAWAALSHTAGSHGLILIHGLITKLVKKIIKMVFCSDPKPVIPFKGCGTYLALLILGCANSSGNYFMSQKYMYLGWWQISIPSCRYHLALVESILVYRLSQICVV